MFDALVQGFNKLMKGFNNRYSKTEESKINLSKSPKDYSLVSVC